MTKPNVFFICSMKKYNKISASTIDFFSFSTWSIYDLFVVRCRSKFIRRLVCISFPCRYFLGVNDSGDTATDVVAKIVTEASPMFE